MPSAAEVGPVAKFVDRESQLAELGVRRVVEETAAAISARVSGPTAERSLGRRRRGREIVLFVELLCAEERATDTQVINLVVGHLQPVPGRPRHEAAGRGTERASQSRYDDLQRSVGMLRDRVAPNAFDQRVGMQRTVRVQQQAYKQRTLTGRADDNGRTVNCDVERAQYPKSNVTIHRSPTPGGRVRTPATDRQL